MKHVVVSLATVMICSVGTIAQAAAADEQPHEKAESEAYGLYYGEGLQHLAEGRQARAVDLLFRAYGLAPSAAVMELIVEAYDRMGHCEAAERQQEYYRRVYGDDDASAPGLDACETTAELTADCRSSRRAMVVNDGLKLRCGESARVPANRSLRVEWRGSEEIEQVELQPQQQLGVEPAEPSAESQARVARIPGLEGAVPRLPFELDDSADVPRLTLPSGFDHSPYRVVQTSDGLFRIWSVRETGETAEEAAEVQIICPEGSDGEDLDCILLR